MLTTTKAGHVTFVHSDEFKGEVEIQRGADKISVPMEALRKLVAESVRHELLMIIPTMKPDSLLKRLA